MAKRIYERVGNSIKQQIIDNVYQQGEKLPTEAELAKIHEVSRTVIREAFIMLEVQGLVETRRGAGIFVTSNSEQKQLDFPSDVNQMSSFVDTISKVGPFELLQARQLIECSIAAFSATQATKKDIEELNEICRLASEDPEQRDSQWDKKFHLKIAQMTNNSALEMIAEILWLNREKNPLWQKLQSHINGDELNDWIGDHKKIVEALSKKDASAAYRAHWEHLSSTRTSIFDTTSLDFELSDKYLFSEPPEAIFKDKE